MLDPVVAALAYVVSILAIALWLPLLALLWVVTWPFDRNRLVAGRFLRLCAVVVAKSFPLWRIRIEGRWPGDGRAYVVVANHQSTLDIFMLCFVPHEMKWIAKESLFKIPWVGWMLRMSGDIPVRRGDATSGGEALSRARRYLADGVSVMMFPEGTRSRDGRLLPFKSGAFRLAVEAGVPVLPIAVSGTAAGMPKGSPWVRRARLSARILDPVEVTGLGLDDVNALRDRVRGRIADAIGEAPASPPTRAANGS